MALALSALVAGVRPSAAQTGEMVGTRALGMGGAFVAVADDASAVYWNPAGLATGAFASLVLDVGRLATGDAADPIPSGPRARRSGVLVALGTPPFGLGYYRLRTEAAGAARPVGLPVVAGPVALLEVTTLVTDHVAATVVQSLADGIHVGASVQAVRGRAVAATRALAPGESAADAWDAAGAQADDVAGGQTTADLDVGVMVDRGRWRAGLVGRHLARPVFSTPRGAALALERQVRAGVAVFPVDRLIVAADADLTTHRSLDGPRRGLAVGAEYWTSTARALGLRAGIRAHTVGESRPAVALGASCAVRRLTYLDLHVTLGGRLADRGVSVSGRILY